ncbi:MAG TPA: Holliday junction branch migration protein RuvA [Syntrophomonadaceae bacterium]|nr:Holliday junction branch migration protein RuvA [Syntrophomonadaceae bacterium]
MISFLRGILLGVEENRVILDVHGIGYEIYVPAGLLQRLPSPGQELEIYTHLYVREDCLQLFGFASAADRALFRMLLKAQGIGPRVALTILDTFNGDEFAEIIARGNSSDLLRIPGVGKKSAQRLLLELKDKLPAQLQAKTKKAGSAETPLFDEVAEALLALGYSRHETAEVIKKIKQRKPGTSVSANDILREALKELGKGKRE